MRGHGVYTRNARHSPECAQRGLALSDLSLVVYSSLHDTIGGGSSPKTVVALRTHAQSR